MGRNRLNLTEEEKKERLKEQQLRYYYKHHDTIRLKTIEKYHQKKQEQNIKTTKYKKRIHTVLREAYPLAKI